MKLSPAQARFLRFFLTGAPDRAVWLRDGKRLALVSDPFAYLDTATHVLVYRLATGEGLTFPGEAVDRTRLSLPDLRELWPYWREPLRTLNAKGEDAARAKMERRAHVCAFRLTGTQRESLTAAAKRAGLAPAVILADVVGDYLERQPQGLKTAVADNSKGRNP